MWVAYRFDLGLVAGIVEAVWGERILKGTRKKRNARGKKEYLRVLVCAPEAPQLAGDGDGVLAGGGVGVAACVRACKCMRNT
jgi:hypothetical protein